MSTKIINKAVAEILNKTRPLFQTITNEGQRNTTDFAIHDILQAFKEDINTIYEQDHLIKQIQFAEIKA